MGHTHEQKVETALRRQWILERLREGVKNRRELAERAREEFGEERLPQGYDSRYISKDLKRIWKKLDKHTREAAKHYQAIQISRLETMLESLWPYTQEHKVEVLNDDGEPVEVTRPPDEKKVDRVLAIMSRLASYYNVEEAPDLNPTDDSDTNIFVQVNQRLLNS